MATSASHATQYRTGNNVVTKPPAPMAQLEMMPQPEAPAGCPPGLEYLTELDQIVLYQQWECGGKVNYKIKNTLGQQMYSASLNYNVWCQPLVTHIFDNTGQEVMRVVQHFQQCANNYWCDVFQVCAENCWCDDCCKYFALNVTVEAPPGQPIGHVRQRGGRWKPHFDVFDANFEPLMKFQGPCLCGQLFRCNCDIDIPLMSFDGSSEIGKLSKDWAGDGCWNELHYLIGDNLSITFPKDLDVKVKGILFGVLFY